MSTPVEYHYLVLLGASKELFLGTFRHAFHQYFEGLAYILGIALSRELVLKFNHFVQTTDLHVFGYIIGQMLGSIRTRV